MFLPLAARHPTQSGSTIIEYVLLACCIAIVGITSVSYLGNESAVYFHAAGEAIAGGGLHDDPTSMAE